MAINYWPKDKAASIIYFSLLSFFLLLSPVNGNAQYLEEGIRNYKQQNYRAALSIFNQIDSQQASLLAGKSYYALRRYDEAQNILNDLLDEAVPKIYFEAAYTSALADFQQKQYANSLNKLYQVFENSTSESLNASAERLYNQILNYLTARQRLSALENVSSEQVRFQLIESALGKVSYSQFQELVSEFYDETDEDEWIERMQELKTSLSDSIAYQTEYGEASNTFRAPDGTAYNIGIILPDFNPDAPEFSITQGIFLGATMAVEEYNDNHSRTKVYLSFLPTGSSNVDEITENFKENDYGDLIVGPLFSDQAEAMVGLSADYAIPVIAPLANAKFESSESLFFQANPTFSIHGKMMARFAVQELDMDRFAVLVARNTNGALSAEAFAQEVEQLGGKIVHYFVEDLESDNYDISPYTKYFDSESEPVDAVYAPFTENRTSYLISQLAESNNRVPEPVTLLGSQKWSDIDFETDVYSRGEVYFSQSAYRGNNNRVSAFRNRFRQRFNFPANQYAAIGYDVVKFVMQALDEVGNPAILGKAIQMQPFYEGLMKNIYFDGSHVNQAVKILEVGSGGDLILRQGR